MRKSSHSIINLHKHSDRACDTLWTMSMNFHSLKKIGKEEYKIPETLWQKLLWTPVPDFNFILLNAIVLGATKNVLISWLSKTFWWCVICKSWKHAISKCFPYIIRYLHKPGCIDIALILTAKKSSPSTLSNNEMSIIPWNNCWFSVPLFFSII